MVRRVGLERCSFDAIELIALTGVNWTRRRRRSKARVLNSTTAVRPRPWDGAVNKLLGGVRRSRPNVWPIISQSGGKKRSRRDIKGDVIGLVGGRGVFIIFFYQPS